MRSKNFWRTCFAKKISSKRLSRTIEPSTSSPDLHLNKNIKPWTGLQKEINEIIFTFIKSFFQLTVFRTFSNRKTFIFSLNYKLSFSKTSSFLLYQNYYMEHLLFSSVTRKKRQISKQVLQENKTRRIFRKTSISYPLIRTRTCAFQAVRNVCFSENLACFVFLQHPFWDLPFCVVADDLYHPISTFNYKEKNQVTKNIIMEIAKNPKSGLTATNMNTFKLHVWLTATYFH